MTKITNLNTKETTTGKKVKNVKIKNILIRIILRIGLLILFLKEKTEMSLKKVNSIYYQIMKITVILNRVMEYLLMHTDIVKSKKIKDVMIKTVPLLTLAYLEHLITKGRIRLKKQNVKNILSSMSKIAIIGSTMKSGFVEYLNEPGFLTVNQVILPMIGMGKQVDKMEICLKEIMEVAMKCLVIDVISDMGKVIHQMKQKEIYMKVMNELLNPLFKPKKRAASIL